MNPQQIQQLREQGLTYQTIGDMFGLSRQRIHQILSPDKYKAYQKTDKFKAYQKAYKKHNYHLKVNKKFDYCEKCL